MMMMLLLLLMTSASSPPLPFAHLTVITVGPLVASTAVPTLSCTFSLASAAQSFTSAISRSVVASLDSKIALMPVIYTLISARRQDVTLPWVAS